MSSDHVTLADYGADVGEPSPSVSDGEAVAVETVDTDLSAYVVDLDSGVAPATLHELASECETVREVADRLGVDADTARDDLDAAERTDSVLTRFEERWGITRAEFESRARAYSLSTDGDRERECEECGNRVTEMSDGREAGHQRREAKGGRCSQFIGGDA